MSRETSLGEIKQVTHGLIRFALGGKGGEETGVDPSSGLDE